MNNGMKLMVLGIAAALIIAVAVLVLTNQDDESLTDEAPMVSIVSFGSGAGEAVLVTENVSGESTPLSGVHVSICRMNVTTENNDTAMRIVEVHTFQTGEDGKVMYNFSAGHKYLVYAEHKNLRGFANYNLTEDEAMMCYQHQWSWGQMNGDSYQYDVGDLQRVRDRDRASW